MAGYRKPYTREEELNIINYIIEANTYNLLKGKLFWKDMEQDENFDRTWQSLREHFLRKMVVKVYKGEYDLTPTQREDILNNIKPKSTKE